MSQHTEDTQLKRADAWRTYAIHLEVCGCGRGDRRCAQGSKLRDICAVADGGETDGVHNTPHPSSRACRRCNAKRDLKATLSEDASIDTMLIGRGIYPDDPELRAKVIAAAAAANVRAPRRVTPESISKLGPDDVFVFGSNTAGIHGKGAAKLAQDRFGAIYGKGRGHSGRSYAIPTRELGGNRALLRTLELKDIAGHVRDFLLYADECPELTFYVTKIGCGYAGYREDEIAPLFAGAEKMRNVVLPAEFLEILCPNPNP